MTSGASHFITIAELDPVIRPKLTWNLYFKKLSVSLALQPVALFFPVSMYEMHPLTFSAKVGQVRHTDKYRYEFVSLFLPYGKIFS